MSFRRGILLLVAAAWLAGPAVAQEALYEVHFRDGRVLEVRSWEVQGASARLALPSGAQIMIPQARIADIRPLALPPESDPAADAADAAETWRSRAGVWAESIEAAARHAGLDPALLAAVAIAESNLDPYAVSHKGACGLVQLMPETARRFGVRDLFDADANLRGGARYLRWLLDRFEGDLTLALAAYNAGENAVDRYDGVPPYPETRRYVRRVLSMVP